MIDLRRRYLMGLMPTDIIINREWSDNDAALMDVIYAQGLSKSKNYMTKREAERVTEIKFDNTTEITDLSVLEHFSNLTRFRLPLPKLQKVVIPNSMKFSVFDVNRGFNGLSQNPITLTDANWLMTLQEYCGTQIYGRLFATSSYTKNIYLNGVKVEGEIVIPESYTNKNGVETPIKTVYAWFCDCIDITGVTLPNSCTTLGFEAFRNCTNLKRIVLNDGLKTIDKNSIKYTGITELIIPDSVTTILGSYGNQGIASCKSLKKVVLSKNVTDTQYGNFSDCTSLVEFDFNGTTKLETIGKDFLGKSKISTIILPNSVKTISDDFCRRCSSLTYVELGENIETIGKTFLYQSSKEKVLVIRTVTPPVANSSYFLVGANVSAIYVPDESVEAYQSAETWSTVADKIKPLSELPQ